MASSDSKVYNQDVETIEEFLNRFRLQNWDALHKYRNDEVRRAMLLSNALPVKVLTDVQRRLQPKTLITASYQELEDNLLAAYSVKKSVVGATVSFLSRKQKTGEIIEDYARSLNQLASQCNYKECCRDRMLRDVFLSGLRSSTLIRALLPDCDDKKYFDCVERAKILEQMAADVEDVNSNTSFSYQNRVEQHNRSSRDNIPPRKAVPDDYICIRCGKNGHHFAHDCFALNKVCRKCSKKGHIASVCKSKKVPATANYLEDDSSNDGNSVVHKLKDDNSSASRRTSGNRFNSLRDECAGMEPDLGGEGEGAGYSDCTADSHYYNVYTNSSHPGGDGSGKVANFPFLE